MGEVVDDVGNLIVQSLEEAFLLLDRRGRSHRRRAAAAAAAGLPAHRRLVCVRSWVVCF